MKDVDYTIKYIFHYEIEDEECDGDYCKLEVFINNEYYQTFQSYYDDKGTDRIEEIEFLLTWLGYSVKSEAFRQNDFDPNN